MASGTGRLETSAAVHDIDKKRPEEIKDNNTSNPFQQSAGGHRGQIVKPVFAGISLRLGDVHHLARPDAIWYIW